MKRFGLFLITMALFASASSIRAEVSGRSGSFRNVVAAELLHGDASGAQMLKNLGNAAPAVPPVLSSQAQSTWPEEARKYENLRIRVRAAITAPAHAPEDQWRVDRAEADLQLVAYELNQNSSADRNLVRNYLYDAWWALDHHIAVSLMQPPAAPAARVEPPAPPPPPPAAPTAELNVEPNSIVEGSCATLTWHTTHATSVQIDGVEATLNGSRQVCPPVSTEYRIMAWGPGGEASDRTRITVTRRPPPPAPPTAELYVDPNSIVEGSCATMTWHTKNATSAKIDGIDAALNGSREVCPAVTTGYMLVARGPGGEASDRTQVTVTPRPPPPAVPLADIHVAPNSIVEGSCATLTWHTTNATSAKIDGVNATLNGSREVCPQSSTGYMIVAKGPGGEASDKTQLTVTGRPARAFRIHFDFDEDVIRADAIDTMSKVARILREELDVTFIVEGHTDWKGTNEYNMDLGMRRAQSIRDYFSVNFGIDPQRLRTISYGEERPVVSNTHPDGSDDPVGRQYNRRGVFVEEKN